MYIVKNLRHRFKIFQTESYRINKDIEKNATELEALRSQVEELSVRNEGGQINENGIMRVVIIIIIN